MRKHFFEAIYWMWFGLLGECFGEEMKIWKIYRFDLHCGIRSHQVRVNFAQLHIPFMI